MNANGMKRVRENCAVRNRVVAGDLRHEAGITYRQLDYWSRLGLLESDDCFGSGSYRTFARSEVAVATMLGRLSKCGLLPSSDLARRAVDAIRTGSPDIVSDGPLTIFIA